MHAPSMIYALFTYSCLGLLERQEIDVQELH
jgi:hypothetical protein